MPKGKWEPLEPGRKFGRLTVLSRETNGVGKNFRYLCRCDCGTEIKTQAGNLHGGFSTSCGCKRRETMAAAHAETRAVLAWHKEWKKSRDHEVAG